MAIKVNNTTVINDSRQLQNIASIDSATSSTLAGALGGGASVQTFTSSGTWTKPSSGTVAMITCIGGGGGGARNNGNINPYSTGGSISVIYKLLSSLGSSETVTIGAGGSMGGTSSNISGGAGGNTKFGTDNVAAGGSSSETYWNGSRTYPNWPSATGDFSSNIHSGYIAGKSTGQRQFGSSGRLIAAAGYNTRGDGTVGSGQNAASPNNYDRWFAGHATGGYSGYGSPQTPTGYGAGGTITHTGSSSGGSAGTSGFCSVIVF
jgi:hypothetical protein